MSRPAAALLMMTMAAVAGSCGPGTNSNPPQLWLDKGTDELHARLVDKGPPAPY